MNNIISKFIQRNRKTAFVFTENDEKILINPKNFNNAFNGDIVEVKIIDKEKLIGKVIAIIEREKKPYIGIVEFNNKNNSIIKLNKSDILVDCENKNKLLKKGDIVSFKINYTTLKNKYINVYLIENFGNSNNSDNIFNSILYSSGVPLSFSKLVERETIQLKRKISEEDLKDRIDLRYQETITIDDMSAKDLDDAIFLEKTNEEYILYVSIADVSHYVKDNTELDKEAQLRGNSIYLVDRVIPMLPSRISNKLCSLNPNEDKLCFTVKITFDLKGKVKKNEFFKSVINSKHRLTYDEVNKMFEKEDKKIPMLFDMLELSKLLRTLKNKKGMINFDLPEIKVILDENNKVKEIKNRVSGLSQNLIEDFMVAANIAVAEILYFKNIPTIYRIHESPDVETLKNLNKNLNLFGYNINTNNIHPGHLAKIIDDSKNKDNSYLIHKTILKSMKRACYSNQNKGHFGLALSNYLHFTSPIRRYSDLIVHRMLNFALTKGYIVEEKNTILNSKFKDISDKISKTERIAENLEKDSIKLKLLDYMKNKIKKRYTAKISGIISNKVFLQLDNFIEIVFYPNDNKKYDIINKNSNYILIYNKNTIYNIGDKLQVMISKLDYEKIEIIAEVV